MAFTICSGAGAPKVHFAPAGISRRCTSTGEPCPSTSFPLSALAVSGLRVRVLGVASNLRVVIPAIFWQESIPLMLSLSCPSLDGMSGRTLPLSALSARVAVAEVPRLAAAPSTRLTNPTEQRRAHGLMQVEVLGTRGAFQFFP
jgi:hypothetical protein